MRTSLFIVGEFDGAGNDNYRGRSIADDPATVRAEKDLRERTDAARADDQHFALLPAERLQGVFPGLTITDCRLHRRGRGEFGEQSLLCSDSLAAPLIGDEVFDLIAGTGRIHLLVAHDESGEPQ